MAEHNNLEGTSPNTTPTAHVPNEARDLIIFHIAVPSVTLVLLILRNYSRFFFLRLWGWDDMMINMGWLFVAFQAGFTCRSIKYGMGRHVWDVPYSDQMRFLRIAWIGQILYLFASFFTKSAFFIFFARLASSGRYYTAARILLFFNTLIFTSCLLTGLFICLPIPFFWDRTIQGGTCLNIRSFYVANASLNMVMDIMTLLLPAAIVWSSPSMPVRKKLTVSALFGLGIITCIFSTLRIPAIAKVSEERNDFTWNIMGSSMYSALELNCAIATGCIPAIKPLIMTLLGRATPVGRTGMVKPPVGVTIDSWALRDHVGSYGASVTASKTTTLGSKGDRGRPQRNGNHILLEESLTIEGTNRSRESILGTLARERSGSMIGQLHIVSGLRRSESRTSRASPRLDTSFLR